MTKELIHQGSVKDIYRLEATRYEFHFSDRISVFDKPIPSIIPGKGRTLCDMACHWFGILDSLGIAHHLVERSGPQSVVVKAVQIIRDYSKIVDGRTNHLIPLEFVVRHYVAGSLNDRLSSGGVDPSQVGLTREGVKYGVKLPRPYFETSTKLEPVDRLLSTQEALEVSRMPATRLKEIEEICLRIDSAMEGALARTNILHVDGKKEFGYDVDGTLMVVDVFGTLDEDRFWDRLRYEKENECIELSKEAVRQYYRKTGYKDALYDARGKELQEPPIPPLPQGLIDEVSEMYADVARQICGAGG
jgi:phosphoribosylaminoimidazole-succinocarboxamide synthase